MLTLWLWDTTAVVMTVSLVVSLGHYYGLTRCGLGDFNAILDEYFSEPITMIDGWDIFCEIALRRMSLDLTDDESTLVQVMAWCHQATSHYLSQCWPRSLSPYDITRPQWVNLLLPRDATWNQITGSFNSLVQVMACWLKFHWSFVPWALGSNWK